MEYGGGAEQVALAGLCRFHGFPRCPTKEMNVYLGHWQELRNRHGSLVPDQSQWVMRQHMLPEDVAKDVRDKKHQLSTTRLVLDYVWGELARYNGKYLSALHQLTARKVSNSRSANSRSLVGHHK